MVRTSPGPITYSCPVVVRDSIMARRHATARESHVARYFKTGSTSARGNGDLGATHRLELQSERPGYLIVLEAEHVEIRIAAGVGILGSRAQPLLDLVVETDAPSVDVVLPELADPAHRALLRVVVVAH